MNAFHGLCQGYGPVEDIFNQANGVIRYGLDLSGNFQGGRKLTSIRRSSQIWLIGDVGIPKIAAQASQNQLPSGGYNTELTVIKPSLTVGWSTLPSTYCKQAAARHNTRANFAACDGHVETWKWSDLSTDKDDVFAVTSF
jgi:prepilin-type processing-associated H-X9-DG protein